MCSPEPYIETLVQSSPLLTLALPCTMPACRYSLPDSNRLTGSNIASSPDAVLISVSGQGPDDLISTMSGGLRLLQLSHGTDLHIEDYNIRVRVHCLRSHCSYHTGMTSTNTDNHSVVCELGLHCYSNPNCLLTITCCNVLRSFLIDT